MIADVRQTLLAVEMMSNKKRIQYLYDLECKLKMKIFVVYDSTGYVWDDAYTSFQSAFDAVSLYIKREDLSPMKMPTEFTYKYAEGSVLFAHDLEYAFCIFFKELTL
jgi:hypothetical protein